MKYDNIKGVIIDYDGAVDIHGDRWIEVLTGAFSSCGVELSRQSLKETAEAVGTYLLTDDLIQPTDDFSAMLRTCAHLMLERLHDNHQIDSRFTDTADTADAIAQYCLDYMNAAFEVDRPSLAALAQRMPLVLVSRSFPNFGAMLDEFDLARYFRKIVWQADDDAVGALKEGASALGTSPSETAVVSGSLPDDVVPALSSGFRLISIADASQRASMPADVAAARNLREATALILKNTPFT